MSARPLRGRRKRRPSSELSLNVFFVDATGCTRTWFDGIREERYLLWRTYVRNPRRRRSAHRTAAGDLGLPGRIRRPAWLPAHCAGDRGRGWARVSFDGSRSSCEPRAARLAEARPDEAACARAPGPRPARDAEVGGA